MAGFPALSTTEERVMGSPEGALASLAARQHGIFTGEQARAQGLSRSQLQRGLAHGRWVRVHRSTYRFTGAPHTWHANVLAACLAGRALASHRTAAVLWELDGYRPGRVEVTRQRGTNFRADGVRSHESLDLHLAGPTTRGGIPVTGIARTLVDLGAVVPRRLVEKAVDDAVRRRLVDLDGLWEILVAHARRGRRGVATLRAVLDDLTPVGSTESWFERLFLKSIVSSGMPMPVTQHEVHDDRGFVARLDVAWPALRVAVELDGRAFHSDATAFELDALKRNRLRLADWVVLVVTWRMFTRHPHETLQTVRQAIEGRQPGTTSGWGLAGSAT